LKGTTIRFCSAAIDNDMCMLRYYWIRFSMLARNILKLIFILLENGWLHRSYYISSSSLQNINQRTSSWSHYHYRHLKAVGAILTYFVFPDTVKIEGGC
jgi:hypothetical protein